MDTTDQLIALVTGSTSGIGYKIASMLASAGYKVIINSSKEDEKAEKAKKEIRDSHYIKADISSENDVKYLSDEIEKHYSKLDILVNNAAITKLIAHNDFESADLEVWQKIFSVNVFGTWLVISKLHKLLDRSSHPKIINIASIAGIRPTGSSIPYAVSKASIIHLTKLLAKTLGPKFIVNAIAPGLIETPWTQSWDLAKEIVSQQAPLKRVGTPDDVASCVMALLQTSYITGEVILVDGGWNLTS